MKSAFGISNLKQCANKFIYTTEKKVQPHISSKPTKYSEFAILGGIILGGFYKFNKDKKMHSWIYRDDIGAPNGIHGYEELVNSVGGHHGHYHWPQEQSFSTFNSAT